MLNSPSFTFDLAMPQPSSRVQALALFEAMGNPGLGLEPGLGLQEYQTLEHQSSQQRGSQQQSSKQRDGGEAVAMALGAAARAGMWRKALDLLATLRTPLDPLEAQGSRV